MEMVGADDDAWEASEANAAAGSKNGDGRSDVRTAEPRGPNTSWNKSPIPVQNETMSNNQTCFESLTMPAAYRSTDQKRIRMTFESILQTASVLSPLPSSVRAVD